MKVIIYLLIAIILLMLAAAIGTRNTDVITVNYMIFQSSMKTSAFMVYFVGLGFLLGILIMLTKYLSLKLRFTAMKRRLDKLAVEKS